MNEDPADLLAIDDEPVILGAIRRVATAEGWRVETAALAGEALNRLAQTRFRLILCDLLLPDMDGFFFLATLVRHPRPTPILMTSGFATAEHAVRSLQAGAIGFLAKPFTADELVAAVRRGLRQAAWQADPASAIGPPPPPGRWELGGLSWALPQPDGTFLVGPTALFQASLGPLRHVRLRRPGEELRQGAPAAECEATDDLVHPWLAPLSGIIRENREIPVGTPEATPPAATWFYRIEPSDRQNDLDRLTRSPLS